MGGKENGWHMWEGGGASVTTGQCDPLFRHLSARPSVSLPPRPENGHVDGHARFIVMLIAAAAARRRTA